jgi:hypothetical protein
MTAWHRSRRVIMGLGVGVGRAQMYSIYSIDHSRAQEQDENLPRPRATRSTKRTYTTLLMIDERASPPDTGETQDKKTKTQQLHGRSMTGRSMLWGEGGNAMGKQCTHKPWILLDKRHETH